MMKLNKHEQIIARIGVRKWIDELENVAMIARSSLTIDGKKDIQESINNAYRLLMKLEK